MPLGDQFAEHLLGQGALQEDKTLDLGKHSGVFPVGQPYTCVLFYTGNSCKNLREKFGQDKLN